MIGLLFIVVPVALALALVFYFLGRRDGRREMEEEIRDEGQRAFDQGCRHGLRMAREKAEPDDLNDADWWKGADR